MKPALLIFVFALLLAACQPASDGVSTPVQETPATSTPSPTETPTSLPSPTEILQTSQAEIDAFHADTIDLLVSKYLAGETIDLSNLTPEQRAAFEQALQEAGYFLPPSDLGTFIDLQQIKSPLPTVEWGPFTTFYVPDVRFRKEDMHIETIDLGNGYVIKAWADTWGQLPSGEYVHYAIPLLVENRNTKQYVDPHGLGKLDIEFTKQMLVSGFSEDEVMYPSDKAYSFGLYLNTIPDNLPTSGNAAYNYMKIFLDFWSPLWQDLYTEEQIQQFVATGDPQALAENQLGIKLPKNFVFYLKTEIHPYIDRTAD